MAALSRKEGGLSQLAHYSLDDSLNIDYSCVMNYLPLFAYWLCWLQMPVTVYLMVRIGCGHELMREAVCPSATLSEEYAEQSDWRR